MKPSTLFWCATAVAACANVSTPTATEAQCLAQARQLLIEDPAGALTITDRLLAENQTLGEAHLLAAEGARLLALRGGGGGQVKQLFEEAAVHLETLIDSSAEPVAPSTWKLLGDCRFDLGQFDAASSAAMAAADGYVERGGESADQLAAEAVLLAANADLRSFVAARQREIDDGTPDDNGKVEISPEVAALAMTAIERFHRVHQEYPAEAVTQVAVTLRWLDRDPAALEELERGIRNHPDVNAIHEAYFNWMFEADQRSALVGAYRRFVRENPSTPLLRWHQGRALALRADELRQQGDFQGAIASYEKALASFGEYGSMMPAHAANTDQWLALCELSIARTAVEIGDYEGARQHLFAADEASPLAVTYDDGMPRLADSFGSHYTAVIVAISSALVDSGDRALARTLEFNEAVLARHPDRWGFLYNNAALAARDLGVQYDGKGDRGKAMELWERSYGYYEKAVALSPEDARITNDCGLMLIYHLGRDFDRARECFDRAIAVGQAQLDAMPDDADQRDRELLEEAVGDAWQNIAVLMKDHLGKPFADYEPFCTSAVRFYPYQRRAAAAMLRDRGIAEAAGKAAAQGGAAEAFAKVEKDARAKAETGDFDSALGLLDKVAKDCKEHAPYQALRGEYNFQLAVQRRDQGKSSVEFFFQDAIAALTKAVNLDSEPNAPRLLLARAQFESTDFEGAAKTASALLLHLQSQGGGDADTLQAAHLVRASSAARVYADKKSGGDDDKDMLTAARASFRLLESKDALEPTLRDLWSATEQWAGAGAEAVNIYGRALAKNPDDQELLGKLVDTASAQNQLTIAIDLLQKRSDATALWYLGKTLYLRAGIEREQQKIADAMRTLDASKKAFTDSMTKNAAYRQNCERWIAWCLGKKGNIAFTQDDLKQAESLLLEAARLSPADVAVDLGMYETTQLGIMKVADKHYRNNDLAKVEAIYRAASDAANGDLILLNNSGLFARDYGNQLEQKGKTKEAMEMYEQSYKAYTRAQQLDPTNVRLRNDCALIAIYHLERDWEQSKQLLDTAIADGEETLRSNPPEDADAARQLDEAVGDCYENLALWHLKHGKDGAAAKAAALKSQEHHPGARRGGARRHLQAAERLLQGK
ncbi:MAG: hypothetical protein KDC98_17960 [Planctomycetes bacterium]|nr:hypothetical protein [Planctomycetota bacterium]